MKKPLEETIQKLIANDQSAYVSLVDTYGEKLLRLAYMVVEDRQISEDVVQESFLALFENLHNFRGESSLATWLMRITLNKAKNKVRPKMYNKLKFFWDVRAPDTNPLPHDNYEQKERQSAVRDILRALPMKYKDVLYLYYFEEMKIKEISLVLDISPSGVKTRLQRGKKKMKELLQERGLD